MRKADTFSDMANKIARYASTALKCGSDIQDVIENMPEYNTKQNRPDYPENSADSTKPPTDMFHKFE